MHVFSGNTLSPTRFFSTGIVCSHRRDVCPWQQICKTHFCRSNPASQCIGSWEHCITLLLALQDVQCNRKAFFVRGYNVIFHRASAGKGLSSMKQTTSNLRMCTLPNATQFVWFMLRRVQQLQICIQETSKLAVLKPTALQSNAAGRLAILHERSGVRSNIALFFPKTLFPMHSELERIHTLHHPIEIHLPCNTIWNVVT